MTKKRCIVSAEVRPASIPVNVPFAISRETLAEARLVLVALRDDDGNIGVGECAPFPTLTYDTADVAEVVARALTAETVGREPAAARAHLAALARDGAAARSITACVGVETALWDLEARQAGTSLSTVFGDAALAAVETDVTLPIMAPAAVPGFWRAFRGHGFNIVKIKVSGNVAADLDLVHAMLAERPPGAAFTLDGNQGYSLENARKILATLAAAGHRPLFFEQPLPEDDWAGLSALSAASDVPVCLDETVRTVADAVRAATDKTARIINLKVMKSGLAGVAAIAATARRAGLDLMIGGMLETEVTMAASLHFACGFGGVRYFDLDTPFFLTRRVTRASPWHRASARLELPRGPGLGLELLPL